jgi:hypothetical protein
MSWLVSQALILHVVCAVVAWIIGWASVPPWQRPGAWDGIVLALLCLTGPLALCFALWLADEWREEMAGLERQNREKR